VTWAVTNISAVLGGLDHPPRVVMACHFPGESPWGPGTDVLLRGVDRFVAVSELALESTPSSIRDKVEVIWNAVDPRRLAIHRDRATMRASWGVPADASVVGYIGRLSPEKDPDAMVRLAAELPEPWHVVIVGEGRERETLTRKIQAPGLERVHIVGGDSQVGDVLGAFDSLVVPSYYESFGLTLAEGLWAGVPVLATRSGLAKLVPGLVREIKTGAHGREIADALLADQEDHEGTADRVNQAALFARNRLRLDRFGQDWTNLLLRTGVPRVERIGGDASLTTAEAVG
jgi:glycosyltransferase involved in cell wall biosynthesis